MLQNSCVNHACSTAPRRAAGGFAIARVAASTVLLCVVSSLPAWAALGGNAASVSADVDTLKGEVRTTLLQSYDIHEITDTNGMRIREYLSRRGSVFAVAWAGPVMPDLPRLLGSHFTAYADALLAQPRTGHRRSLRVVTADLVLESGGHMRAIAGRAYLPAELPAGVSPTDIR